MAMDGTVDPHPVTERDHDAAWAELQAAVCAKFERETTAKSMRMELGLVFGAAGYELFDRFLDEGIDLEVAYERAAAEALSGFDPKGILDGLTPG